MPPDYSGCAMAAVTALIARGPRRLHLVGVPTLGLQGDRLIAAGAVAIVEAAAVTLGEFGGAPAFEAALRERRIAMKDATCPAIHAGLQAAERGVGSMPVAGIVGSDLVRHRAGDWVVVPDPFTGRPTVHVRAITPDIALFHAALADRHGNVWIGVRRELMTMAHAARRTLVSVERIVDEDLPGRRPYGGRHHPGSLCRGRRHRRTRRVAGRLARGIPSGPRRHRRLCGRGPAGAGRVSVSEGIARPDIRARQLFMIATIANLLAGTGHVAIGSTSPIPAAGALLARRRDPTLRVSVLGSERHNAFTDGDRELFDCAAQGRIDAFFLSGGQIDGAGRINLVGIGPYPDVAIRFPGSFGSAFLYPLVPRVILFREVHTRRVLVERVDFVSAAPGSRATGGRNDGPYALVTGLAAFRFDQGRFTLRTLAPGTSEAAIAEATGFAYDSLPPEPFHVSAEVADAIDGIVGSELSADYPAFAESWAAREIAA